MSKSRYYVVPHAKGWAIRTGSPAGPARLFRTQAEAIEAAKNDLRSAGGELKIRDAKGVWRSHFTLGRDAMRSISAVEGINLSSRARARLAEFDRKNLSDPERRREISRLFARKA